MLNPSMFDTSGRFSARGYARGDRRHPVESDSQVKTIVTHFGMTRVLAQESRVNDCDAVYDGV
ncbi:hypothetical protein ABD05_20075 [Burkholderia pyrrocinia]|nr:hypothetical protein ABD05_20075 [Burkholderia pyrrocinia]